ncbi:MAG: hypothetical protein Q7S16_01605 [bacterium]|nr:hypothetical protein [bacterium]
MSAFWEEYKRSPGEPILALGMGIAFFLAFVVHVWCLADGRIDFGAELHNSYGISGAISFACLPGVIALALLSLESLARVIEKKRRSRKQSLPNFPQSI